MREFVCINIFFWNPLHFKNWYYNLWDRCCLLQPWETSQEWSDNYDPRQPIGEQEYTESSNQSSLASDQWKRGHDLRHQASCRSVKLRRWCELSRPSLSFLPDMTLLSPSILKLLPDHYLLELQSTGSDKTIVTLNTEYSKWIKLVSR